MNIFLHSKYPASNTALSQARPIVIAGIALTATINQHQDKGLASFVNQSYHIKIKAQLVLIDCCHLDLI